jgi:apolipoprotein D and lipocalin family protein
VKFSDNGSKVASIRGRAYPVENSGNARLKVQFFWPFRGNYYIIGIAGDYSWALVGTPSRKYLWVLSRESYMPTDTYNEILEFVKKSGYTTGRLIRTPQNCDTRE